MLALTAAPGAPGNASRSQAPDPQPLPNQAVVEVKAFSLNRGETVRLASMKPGELTGWDVAGVVAVHAADGSGPPRGARVVGLVGRGAWAERVAVNTDALTELPDGVTFARAATLPVAGLTALKALDVIGNVLSRTVLVTGASGGVGSFAIQLAKLAGAHVTALSTRPERAAGLRQLGADEVIHALEPEGKTFEAIIEGVGGTTLGQAVERIAPGGTVVSFAATDPSDRVSYPTRTLFGRASGATIYGMRLWPELAREQSGGRDLLRLAELVAAGRLSCPIGYEGSWSDATKAIEALLERRITGKAVLHVD